LRGSSGGLLTDSPASCSSSNSALSMKAWSVLFPLTSSIFEKVQPSFPRLAFLLQERNRRAYFPLARDMNILHRESSLLLSAVPKRQRISTWPSFPFVRKLYIGNCCSQSRPCFPPSISASRRRFCKYDLQIANSPSFLFSKSASAASPQSTRCRLPFPPPASLRLLSKVDTPWIIGKPPHFLSHRLSLRD